MDKGAWNSLLIVATASIVALSLVTLALARPRGQVLAPFLPSVLASTVIYLSLVDGASGFHTAVEICTAAALALAGLLTWLRPERNTLATFSWALLGVVTPYCAFFLNIAVACAGKSECLG